MNWVWRVVKWGILGVILLPIFGLLLGNLFINTGSFKEKLGASLRANLGLAVGFESVSYWPWSGMTVRGFSVDVPERPREEGSRGLAEVGEIRLEPELLSLLSDEIVVKRVAISAPVLDCLRTRDGRLLLPIPRTQLQAMRVARAEKPSAPPSVPSPQKTPAPPQSPKPAVPTAPAKPPEVAAPSQKPVPPTQPAQPLPPVKTEEPKLPHGIFLHQIGKRVGVAELELEGGEVRVLAEGIRTPLFEIADYGLNIDLEGEGAVAGEAEIESLRILGAEMGTRFSSPVELRDGGDVFFSDIKGGLLSGTSRGKMRLSATQPGVPFSIQFGGMGLSVEDFGEALSALELPIVPDAGEVDFAFAAKGLAEVPETVEGTFEVRGRDLDASDLRALIPAVRSIGGGRAMVMADLFETDLDATIQVKQGVLALSNFRARTKHLIVRCHGISAQGKVQLRARIYATKEGMGFFKEVGKRVGGAIDPGFVELPNTSWFYRELEIKGAIADPVGDFLQPEKPIRLSEAFAIVQEAAEKRGGQ